MKLFILSLLFVFLVGDLQARTVKVEEKKQKFVPIVTEEKTIFIDTEAKRSGNGSYKNPFNSFEKAIPKINKQDKNNVVFIRGVPKEGFDFKQMQVFGPKTPVVVSRKEKNKETLRVIAPRKASEEKEKSLRRIKSSATILGFNDEVNTQPIKTVVRTVVKDEGAKSSAQKSSSLPSPFQDHLDKIQRKEPPKSSFHFSQSFHSPTSLGSFPQKKAPLPPKLIPQASTNNTNTPPPIAPGNPPKLPNNAPPPPSPNNGPPPLPNNAPPPPPPPPNAGGGPPIPGAQPPQGGAKTATNSALNNLNVKKVTKKSDLAKLLKDVDLGKKDHENLRLIELNTLFQFLSAYISKSNLENDNGVRDVIRNFGNRIKSHISGWSVEKIQKRTDLVYKAVKEEGNPLANLGNLSAIRKAVGKDVGKANIPSIFESLDANTFGAKASTPYSFLHYIFEFKPYATSGGLPGGNVNPVVVKKELIDLIPDMGEVSAALAPLDAYLQKLTKDHSNTYYKLSKTSANIPAFRDVDKELRSAINPNKEPPKTNSGYTSDYIDAYKEFFKAGHIYAAKGKALVDIMNSIAYTWKNEKAHLEQTIKTVSESRRRLLKGYLLLNNHNLPSNHNIPSHAPNAPLPVPQSVNPVPQMPPGIKSQYDTLTAHQSDLEGQLQNGGQLNLNKIKSFFTNFINNDDVLKAVFIEGNLPEANIIETLDYNEQNITEAIGQKFITSQQGGQLRTKILSVKKK